MGRCVDRSSPVLQRGGGVLFITINVHARVRIFNAATHRVEVPSTSSNNTALTARAVLDLMRRYRALLFHDASCVYSHAFREDRWSRNPTPRVVRSAEGQTSPLSHQTSNADQMRCMYSLPAHIRASLMALVD